MLDEWHHAALVPDSAPAYDSESSTETGKVVLKLDDYEFEVSETSDSMKSFKPDISEASGLPLDMLILKYPFSGMCPLKVIIFSWLCKNVSQSR